MISVQLLKDSISDARIRLTTFILKYPRFIHAEMMTHRVFSRNASSSRAIPLKTQIEMLKNDLAFPEDWRYNQSGMQGFLHLTDIDQIMARQIWLEAAYDAIKHAERLGDLNVHKQTANRLLEPFSHISVILTATEFANFFALRTHETAQPEIQILANLMYDVYNTNSPTYLKPGMWHLPFVDDYPELETETVDGREFYTESSSFQIISSVARCARVSYLKHDKTNPSAEDDIKLYDRLLGASPIHASPAEHQAMATDDKNLISGNFRGWLQYRKTLENENIKEFKCQK